MRLALRVQNRNLEGVNRQLRQLAEEGVIVSEEADVILQFMKAQKEYLQRNH